MVKMGHHESGVSGVLLIAIFGLGIALGLFLITFITSQRARIHPQQNLRIPVFSPPPVSTLPPRSIPTAQPTPPPGLLEELPETPSQMPSATVPAETVP